MRSVVDRDDMSLPSDSNTGAESTPTPGGVEEPSSARDADESVAREEVRQPAKVMRIGAMLTELLGEVRQPLDEASRSRLRQIYDESVRELASTLSPDLADELHRMALADSGPTPSAAELRVAQAQLVGWLDGLFEGVQASLLARRVQAETRLTERSEQAATAENRRSSRAGTYL
jgi:hypothetical protein